MPDYLAIPRVLFGFRGRISRSRYWLVVVAATVLFGAICALAMVFGPNAAGRGPDFVVFVLAAAIAAWKLSLLSAMARRLHDLNQPGWWVIPLLLVLLFAVVILGCMTGDRGRNRFGPDPLATEVIATA
jgi:uncharacterized membrane protein YhaH (DUF805 family)